MTPDAGQVLTNQVIGDFEAERLLLVDDEEVVRLALTRYLTSRGYVVDAAAGAEGALLLLGRNRYALMLCDIRMPGMSGLELVPAARAIDPDLAVVMLSAVSDAPSAIEALGLGAMDYLTKPLDLRDLGSALERVNRRRRLAVEQRNVERLIAAETARLTRLHAHELGALADGAVHGLVRVAELLEARSPSRAGRGRHMAAVAEAVSIAIGLPASRVWQIRSAGQLADLGQLLDPTGALTTEAQAARALDVLSGLTSLADLVEAVRDQGEHWDGRGAPRGLARDAISLGGRVLAATRAFIELTLPRDGSAPLSADGAVAALSTDAGRGLDPGVHAALAQVIHDRRLLGFGVDLAPQSPPPD